MYPVLSLLLSFLPVSQSFDPNPADINRKCFTCSVFTFIDNKLLCANPGVCYSNYCYQYVLSDQRSMFLAGCAEDITDYPFRSHDDRVLCHARGYYGLCLCETHKDACNVGNITKMHWFDTEAVMMNAVSHRVTGFSADYAKSRVQQLRVEGYPEQFPGFPLNTATFNLSYLFTTILFLLWNSLCLLT